MSELDRRTVVRGAVWAVPVIAVAVAAPLAAASDPAPPTEVKDRIAFTNATATVGSRPNSIYVNTKIRVTDGPAPVEQLMLTVSISRDGQTYSQTFAVVAGWGATDIVQVEFPNVPQGSPVVVTFTAWAVGVKTIVAETTVVTPTWWS